MSDDTDEKPDGAGQIALPKRSPIPEGAAFAYVNDVTRHMGEPYVRSWLSAMTCQFSDGIIWTTDLVADTLRRDTENLIGKHGIVIRVDQQSREHFKRNTAQFVQ